MPQMQRQGMSRRGIGKGSRVGRRRVAGHFEFDRASGLSGGRHRVVRASARAASGNETLCRFGVPYGSHGNGRNRVPQQTAQRVRDCVESEASARLQTSIGGPSARKIRASLERVKRYFLEQSEKLFSKLVAERTNALYMHNVDAIDDLDVSRIWRVTS